MEREEGKRVAAQQRSRARFWPPLARFVAHDAALSAWAAQRRSTAFIYELVRFGVKQAWACLFGGLMVGLLIVVWAYYPKSAPIARYDVLALGGLAIQIGMIWSRLETREEALVIFIFHVVGTVMESFKTAVGSWIYPEPSVLRIGGVPLFSGFMYAAVGSYIARAWRLFDFRFTNYPPLWMTVVLAVAIYINFFAHHYLPDVRLVLFAAFALLFGRCWIYYRVHHSWRRMPVLLSTGLVAAFIWLAENVGTFTGSWLYPSQKTGWHMVPLSKLGAWYLLMIISAVLVSLVNRPEPWREAGDSQS